MAFAKRIEELVIAANNNGQIQLREGLRQIANAIGTTVAKATTETLVIRLNADATVHGAELCRSAAIAIDAAAFVAVSILNSPGHLIVDLPMSSTLEGCQKTIRETFETKRAPKRGFAYLSWTPHPEVFYYVGRGGSDARLELSKHGKLAWSTSHASTLSLVFPGRSTRATLMALEGSMMQLVKARTGKLPILNDDKAEEFPPLGDAAMTLARFGLWLSQIGGGLSEDYQ